MPKTGLQLMTEAQTLTEDEKIKSANGLIWLNEFLSEKLGSNAMIKSTEDYPNSVAHTSYSLPIGFEKLHKVEEYTTSAMTSTVDRINDRYKDFEIDDETILFEDDGQFKLHYFILPTELTTINDTVSIDPSFYFSCKLWLAYRQLTFSDEDNAASNSLGQLRMQEFYNALNTSVNERKQKFKLKHRIRAVR